MIRVVVIDSLDAATSLAAEWDRVPTGGSSGIFTSSAWALSAWRHLPELGDPCLVVALDRADAVAGVLPLSVCSGGIAWAGSPLGDEHDPRLLRPDIPTVDVVAALVGAVVNQVAHRPVTLRDCKPGGLLEQLLTGSSGCPAPTLPIADLDPEFGALGRIPGWSRDRRRGLRSTSRRLSSEGVVALDWVEDPVRLRNLMPEFISQRLAAWEHRNRLSELPEMDRHPAFPTFLTDAAQGLAEAGRCVLVRLCLDGVAIAQSLFFKTQSSYHWYMSTFRIEMARFSPSHLLLAEVADRAAGEGIGFINLGRGDEPYKFDHGAVARHLADVVLAA